MLFFYVRAKIAIMLACIKVRLCLFCFSEKSVLVSLYDIFLRFTKVTSVVIVQIFIHIW